MACLVEEGYKRTTLSRVTQLAGSSLGAQQHHFRTKAELVTSAVEYLAEARIKEIRALVADLEGSSMSRAAVALDMTWETLSGRLNVATRELWTAARTDPALREVLVAAERRTGRALRGLFREVLPPGAHAEDALELAIDALRGLALRRVLLGDQETEAVWRRYRPIVVRLLEPEGT